MSCTCLEKHAHTHTHISKLSFTICHRLRIYCKIKCWHSPAHWTFLYFFLLFVSCRRLLQHYFHLLCTWFSYSMQHLPIVLAIFGALLMSVFVRRHLNFDFFFLTSSYSSSSKPVIAIKISHLFVCVCMYVWATTFCFALIKFGIQNEYFIVKLFVATAAAALFNLKLHLSVVRCLNCGSSRHIDRQSIKETHSSKRCTQAFQIAA